jgi:hypothetical protein
MALQISTPLNTSIGVTVSNSYARIGVTDDVQGTFLLSNIKIYATKESFESGADPLPVLIGERFMQVGITIEYDRSTMGGDVLGLAHQAWITQLAQWNITAIEDLA